MTGESLEERYANAKADRQKYVDAVLASSSRHKIVVAGPGTGKTYLFKQMLNGRKNPLTLSFINNLVDDLMLELCGLSDVRTLHSYARYALQKITAKEVKLFSKLPDVIAEDLLILEGKKANFDEIFQTRDDGNSLVDFYREKRRYYGHYGYHDIVFALVKCWEKFPEKILAYGQVIVDEFQDFNKLEVSLIEQLAQKSPILLVGDDDQALYGFKKASAEYIRERHDASNSAYESFVLPYCSRCTRVIVDAANDIVKSASERGYLKNRIQKPYRYFDDREKDRDSSANPAIVYTQAYEAAIPYFIDQQIQSIAEREKTKFSVLIISPLPIKLRDMETRLREKGFANVQFGPRSDKRNAPGILDGLRILLDDRESALGWRIVAKALLEPAAFKARLEMANKDSISFLVLVDDDTRRRVRELLVVLRKIRRDESTTIEEIDDICELTDRDPYAMAKADLKREIPEKLGATGVGRKIPIKLTTIQGSKGLADDYVFITSCDDQYLAKTRDAITDHEICSFLVALTRAKKKVFLVSSQMKEPTFLTWIASERIQRLT